MSYVYIQTENWIEQGVRRKLFTVGFYKPDGCFEPDSDHADRQEAARRVHYLNGGADERPKKYTFDPEERRPGAYWIEILWGENPEPDDKPVRYEFNTRAEFQAFIHGIEESDGWMKYEINEVYDQ